MRRHQFRERWGGKAIALYPYRKRLQPHPSNLPPPTHELTLTPGRVFKCIGNTTGN
ncbi:hypothetical protein [Limnospira fusiformis]|nr:hypothetical protein HFV01_11085 [Limnospira fusiformis SAG 85.79]